MNKRIVVGVVLAVLLAASAYAQTPDFWTLADRGTLQEIQAAISKGADMNAKDGQGMTALMLAAKDNSIAVVSALLKAGADVNAKDLNGGTALIWAAYQNTNQVVSALLKAGADINAKNNQGQTALMIADLYGNKGALKVLKEASK